MFTTVLNLISILLMKIIVINDDGTNQETDLRVTSTTGNTLKVFGDFGSGNDKIRGKVSDLHQN